MAGALRRRAPTGAELHPALDRSQLDVIVDKGQAVDTDGYSGFEGTDLEALLRERGITQVTVVGLATDYCVKNTALDALRAGFAGHGRHHRRARRRGRARATPSGRWPKCARPAA